MITNNRNQEELKRQQTAQQTPAAVQQTQQQAPAQGQNQVMQGVTDNTRQKLQQAQKGYQPTEQATAANQALQSILNQKPQGYTSKYSGQLENILQQLQNGQKFNYNVNDDAYFQSLKDTKTQLAKQAAMDVMGNAAALTGGYGNTAAQGAANQQYQQSLLSLNDDAMNAYQLALQRFQMEQQGLGDQFNMLAQLEGQDYNRYRDTVGDWEREREYLTNRADVETERGREDWRYNLDYLTQLAQIENADYRNEQERQEAIRQFEAQYALQQEQLRWQQDVDQRNYDRDVLVNDRNYDRSVLESDRNYDRSVLESDRAYEQAMEQLRWQQAMDERNFDRSVLESDRNYDRAAMESDRNFDRNVLESDRAYEQALEQLRWQQAADERNYNRDVLESDRNYARSTMESDRNYDRGVLESDRNYEQALEQLRWQQNTDQRNFDRDVLESDRSYGLQKNQQDWQQSVDQRNYERDVLESDRAYDLQKNQQDWQKAVDERNYNREVLESDRAYALQKDQIEESKRQFNESLDWDKLSAEQKTSAQYALAILESGSMPSDDLLQAAGLSAEDAEKLKAQTETTGGTGGGGTRYYVDEYGNIYKLKDGKYIAADKKDIKPSDTFDMSHADKIKSQAVNTAGTKAAQNASVNLTEEQIKKLLK